MLSSRSYLVSLISFVLFTMPLLFILRSATRFRLQFMSLDLNRALGRLSVLRLETKLNIPSRNILVRRMIEKITDTQINIPPAALSWPASVPTKSCPQSTGPPLLIRGSIANSTMLVCALANVKRAAQPPELSTSLLVLLTGGALLLLSVLALAFYCCARCRRRRQQRKLERLAVSRKAANNESPHGKDRGRWVEDVEGGRSTGNLYRFTSPSTFEFSPPSPSWHPTLPSMAFVSGYANGNSIGSGSFRGPILSAETIMREREPRRPRQMHDSAVSGSGNGKPVGLGQRQDQRAQDLRGTAGIKMAPPLPTVAPQAYRPPAYHRPSRIVRIDQKAPVVKVQSAPQQQMVAVPRIEVHPAQDGPHPSRMHARDEQYEPERVVRHENDSDPLTRKVNSNAGRPMSGLGISTIDLNSNATNANPSSELSYLSIHPALVSRNSPIVSFAHNSSYNLQADDNIKGRRAGRAVSFCPSSPASDEDVRLAYTVSASSIGPAREMKPATSMSQALSNRATMRANERSSVALMSPARQRLSGKISTDAPNSESVASQNNQIHRPRLAPSTIETKAEGDTSGSDEHETSSRLMRSSSRERSITVRRGDPSAEDTITVLQTRDAHPGLSYSSSTKRSNSAKRHDCAEPHKSRASGARALSSKRSDSLRRRGLGTGTIDRNAKSELHEMQSLGSESFDSLIAYLDDTVEPGAEGAAKETTVITLDDPVRPGRKEVNANEKQNQAIDPNMRVTREETVRVDVRAYEAWVESLNASPSVLKLAHVDIGSVNMSGDGVVRSRMSCRAGRSRNTSLGKDGTRESKLEEDAIPRMALEDRDSRVAHSQVNAETRARSTRASVHGSSKANMHVRALRARSASLKVKTQVRDESEVASKDKAGYGARSSCSGKLGAPDQILSLGTGKQIENEKRQDQSARCLAAVTTMPSFSIPSSATQLYAAFPSSAASSAGSLSGSFGKASDNARSSELAAKWDPCASSSGMVPVLARTIASNVPSPTPNTKSLLTHSFLSPSPTMSTRRFSIGSTMSVGSAVSIGGLSASSTESNVSAWGRRSEWGRESLTPRFDHLRAVFEQRFEEPLPPLPVSRETKKGKEAKGAIL